jgi:hypothetical protein
MLRQFEQKQTFPVQAAARSRTLVHDDDEFDADEGAEDEQVEQDAGGEDESEIEQGEGEGEEVEQDIGGEDEPEIEQGDESEQEDERRHKLDVSEDFDTQLLQGLKSMLNEQMKDSKLAKKAFQEVEKGRDPSGIDRFFESYQDVVQQQSNIYGIITGVFSARKGVLFTADRFEEDLPPERAKDFFLSGDTFEGDLPPDQRRILQQSRHNVAMLTRDYNEMVSLIAKKVHL